MASAFEQLSPCKWRDVEFPLSSIRVSFEQDLVQHKYWGVDAANVEATGRGVMTIEAVIPFVNGIVPGKGENWGVLYPTAFRDFARAFADRTTGTFVHPELGEIVCKPHTFEVRHDPQRRDGVEVTATWYETNDDDHGVNLLAAPSPVQEAALAGLDLDASTGDIRSLADKWQPPVFQESFASMMNKITGAIDQVSLQSKLAVGKVGQVLYRVSQVEDSIARAKTPMTWPSTDAIERMKNAAHDIAVAVAGGDRQTLRYTVPTRTTIAGLLAALPPGTALGDLMKLNPALMSRPEVPAGSVVRYFAPKTK